MLLTAFLSILSSLLFLVCCPLSDVAGLLEETPLMWAVRKHYYAMIQLLVQRGADRGSFLESSSFLLFVFHFLLFIFYFLFFIYHFPFFSVCPPHNLVVHAPARFIFIYFISFYFV